MTNLLLLLFLFQSSSPSPCDINGDGVVNVADVQTLIDVVIGMSPCPLKVGGGGITVTIANQMIGPEPALNMSLSTGSQVTCTDDTVNHVLTCASSVNTALMATHGQIQAGKEFYCKSTSGSQAYTCSLSATSALTTYTEGMALLLNVDSPCSGNCTLNVDGVGQKNLLQADGKTLPGVKITPGQAVWVWYDGINFRLMY